MGKRNNIGRHAVHRSAAEGRALVEQWRESGLSVSEFCRRQSVGAHVLRYWLSREATQSKSGARASEFFVVSAPQREPATAVGALASSSVDGGRRAGSAVIVVLPTATCDQLVRTLRGLLAEVRA